ncbi:MAG: GGDEF domain-containing protein [Mariprofundaceae bacterium]|nr:GGDEF domain-containing protein [Mariprofundaceae bacterium]
MTQPKESPNRALILGGGQGGSAILEMLQNEALVDIVGVADRNPDAPAILLAKENGIPTYHDIEGAIKNCAPCIAFNLTGNEMVEDVAAGILGVGGIIGGLEAKLILKMVNRLKDAKEKLLFEATHDPLTGAYNRRHILAAMNEGIAQSRRYGFPYSVVLIDLDHFKSVNDTHGHPAGDAVLKSVVNTLQSNIRDVDILGRWGGEEFLVLLPHTPEAQAIIAAKKWLANVAAGSVALPDDSHIFVSFSAGVAEFSPGDANTSVETEAENLIRIADKYLYQAKEAGRNCIAGGGTTNQQT